MAKEKKTVKDSLKEKAKKDARFGSETADGMKIVPANKRKK